MRILQRHAEEQARGLRAQAAAAASAPPSASDRDPAGTSDRLREARATSQSQRRRLRDPEFRARPRAHVRCRACQKRVRTRIAPGEEFTCPGCQATYVLGSDQVVKVEDEAARSPRSSDRAPRSEPPRPPVARDDPYGGVAPLSVMVETMPDPGARGPVSPIGRDDRTRPLDRVGGRTRTPPGVPVPPGAGHRAHDATRPLEPARPESRRTPPAGVPTRPEAVAPISAGTLERPDVPRPPSGHRAAAAEPDIPRPPTGRDFPSVEPDIPRPPTGRDFPSVEPDIPRPPTGKDFPAIEPDIPRPPTDRSARTAEPDIPRPPPAKRRDDVDEEPPTPRGPIRRVDRDGDEPETPRREKRTSDRSPRRGDSERARRGESDRRKSESSGRSERRRTSSERRKSDSSGRSERRRKSSERRKSESSGRLGRKDKDEDRDRRPAASDSGEDVLIPTERTAEGVPKCPTHGSKVAPWKCKTCARICDANPDGCPVHDPPDPKRCESCQMFAAVMRKSAVNNESRRGVLARVMDDDEQFKAYDPAVSIMSLPPAGAADFRAALVLAIAGLFLLWPLGIIAVAMTWGRTGDASQAKIAAVIGWIDIMVGPFITLALLNAGGVI